MVLLIIAFSLTSVQGMFSLRQTATTFTETMTVTQPSQGVDNYSNYSFVLSLIGNGAVLASLVFLAFQIRQQREDERFTVFEKLMSDFTQLNLILVNRPDIADYLYPSSGAEWKNSPTEKRMAFYYLDSVLGLCERAWTAGKKSKAEQNEWIGWRNWLKSFAKGPLC